MRAARGLLAAFLLVGWAVTGAGASERVRWKDVEPQVRHCFVLVEADGNMFATLSTPEDSTPLTQAVAGGCAESAPRIPLSFARAEMDAVEIAKTTDREVGSAVLRRKLWADDRVVRIVRLEIAKALRAAHFDCPDCQPPMGRTRDVRLAELMPYLERSTYVGMDDFTSETETAVHVCVGDMVEREVEDAALAEAALSALVALVEEDPDGGRTLRNVAARARALVKEDDLAERSRRVTAIYRELLLNDSAFLTRLRPMLRERAAAAGLRLVD